MIVLVQAAAEEFDLAVQVAGAEHRVEVDHAIEEAPGHVTHQRAQEGVGADGMRLASVLDRPGDGDEILVALEGEGAELEGLVACDGGRQLFGDCVHEGLL